MWSTSDLGALGGVLLAICAVPQLWTTVRTGSAAGLSWGFLFLWGGGELAMLGYALATYPDDWRLLVNYGANAGLVAVLVWYRARPRRT